MKIGVISDTHGLLREEVIDNLEGCNYIIHAGDIGSVEIIDKLNTIAKTFAVRGNNDTSESFAGLPEFKEIEMDETLIYVTHDKAGISKNLTEVDLVIYGHSHKYTEEKNNDVLYLNPGSCGKKRFSIPLSMAIVEINLDEIRIEKIDINN